jgi:hypothetical protein
VTPIHISDNQNKNKNENTIVSCEKPTQDYKRRGRKPKGGKITSKTNKDETVKPPPPNVILHLKCSTRDVNEYNSELNKIVTNPLNYDAAVPPEIMTYNILDKGPFSAFTNETIAYVDKPTDYVCSVCNSKKDKDKDGTQEDSTADTKEINQKLKALKVALYKNTISEKKAACFWCTYEYDNPSCHIPKYEMDGSIHGYGSFCRPECAVAFLMKEGIDDSAKFERYHLLNQLYGSIYQFKNNIKPAPDPHYLLEKFYGNMTIQEFRKLLNMKHMLSVVEKPLTRILPELHEETDDFLIGLYGGVKGGATQAGGVYKVKRQSEKKLVTNKPGGIKDTFGIITQ